MLSRLKRLSHRPDSGRSSVKSFYTSSVALRDASIKQVQQQLFSYQVSRQYNAV